MSTQPWSLKKAALTVPCLFCGAKAGEQCRTRSGRRSSYAHGPRTSPLLSAFSHGFEEGREVQQNIDARRGGVR